MRYRVIEKTYEDKPTYEPQVFIEGQGWKQVGFDTFYDIEDAKNVCREHALDRPKVVWQDEF